ncbi:MAG: hypothetical protein NXI32_11065 [bacterium]|nr:hypothetical protein [bacterium]
MIENLDEFKSTVGSNYVVEGFDRLVLPSESCIWFNGGEFNSSSTLLGQGPSLINEGLIFRTSSDAYFGWNSSEFLPNVGSALRTAGDGLEIDFPDGIDRFAAVLYTDDLMQSDAVTLTVFNSSDQQIAVIDKSFVAELEEMVLGVQASEEISKIRFETNGKWGSPILDGVFYGTSVVPEPGMVSLATLLSCAFLHRRRSRK